MNIDFHKQEYNQACLIIDEAISRKKYPKRNPYTISNDIYKTLGLLRSNDKNTFKVTSYKLRAFHDFYGWKSKDSLENLGLCSGAIYRTSGYLGIEPNLRSGSKANRKESFGVHIEHSIPVASILSVLVNKNSVFESAENVFDTIMKHSLCIAFSRKEEEEYIRAGCASSHPQICAATKLPDPSEIEPFIRYEPEIEIYSVVTSQKVKANDTLGDLNSFLRGNRIYSWERLERFYGKPD